MADVNALVTDVGNLTIQEGNELYDRVRGATSTSDKINALAETVLSLTGAEIAQYQQACITAWGIKDLGTASAPASAPAQAKAEVSVILTGFADDKKIAVLKKVREYTSLGLLEAKAFVESLPKPVKENIDPTEANTIKSALEAEGGKVEIK
jgi:large subunit ribosomal protein L7/L12